MSENVTHTMVWEQKEFSRRYWRKASVAMAAIQFNALQGTDGNFRAYWERRWPSYALWVMQRFKEPVKD